MRASDDVPKKRTSPITRDYTEPAAAHALRLRMVKADERRATVLAASWSLETTLPGQPA